MVGAAGQRGELDRIGGDILQHLDAGAQVGRLRFVFLDADPPQAFDQHAHGVVRELEHLQHPGATAELEEVLRLRIIEIRFLLQDQAEQAVAFDHVINQPDALRGVDQQRRDHSGEDDNVRQAQDGQGGGQGLGGGARRHGHGDYSPLLLRRGAENAYDFGVGCAHLPARPGLDCRMPKKVREDYLPSDMGTRTDLEEGWDRGTSTRRKPFWYAALAWLRSKPGGTSNTHSKVP